MNDARRAPAVLVVEDEWLLREEISEEFRHAGWNVLESSTGEDGLAAAQHGGRLDAVVTDIGLAGMLSGWDVAEALRLMRPELAIVYASGNSGERARMVSGSIFLTKPYRTAEIVETCRRLCGLAADSSGSATSVRQADESSTRMAESGPGSGRRH